MASIVLEVVIPPGVMPGQSFNVQGPSGVVLLVSVPAGAAPGTRLSVHVPQAQRATPAGPTPFHQLLHLQVAPAAPPPRAPPPQQPAVQDKRLPPGWTRTSKVDGKGEIRYRIACPGGSRSASYPTDA
eukprot:3855572-Prymnesium_polylepis.1